MKFKHFANFWQQISFKYFFFFASVTYYYEVIILRIFIPDIDMSIFSLLQTACVVTIARIFPVIRGSCDIDEFDLALKLVSL